VPTISIQDAEKLVQAKSDDELLAVVRRPAEWQAGVVDAAKAELAKRGVAYSAPPATPANTPEAIAARYTGGEQVQIARIVYWKVDETPENPGGLAGRATSGIRPKDMALGLLFGPLGVLFSVATDQHQSAQCTCDVGVLAVGEEHVFLLKYGRMPMQGETAVAARLPAKLLNGVPSNVAPTKVVAFRPLHVAATGDELRVHVLGKPPVTVDTAFSAEGNCLIVRTPDFQTAEQIARATARFATYPLPEEAMAAILAKDSAGVERAFAESDYVRSFVSAYMRQRQEVRSALALAARSAPEYVIPVLARCIASRGRGGSPSLTGILGIFFFGCGAVAAVAGLHDYATGSMRASDVSSVLGLFATLIPLFGFGGLTLLGRGWWWDGRWRQRERELFAVGGGLGAGWDAFLALVALDRDWQACADWLQVETALRANPLFAQRLGAVVRSRKEEKRGEFLQAAPPSARQAMIETMLAFRGAVSPSIAIGYTAVWLPCLALGIYGAARGFAAGPAGATVFLLGICLGFGGGIPAIVLGVIQIQAWRSRRWARNFLRGGSDGRAGKSSTKRCPRCGAIYPATDRVCPSCLRR
jgi:hypothetical protein